MANLNHQETSSDDFFYDVFLSFRGEDGDRRFTDHLFTALRQKGINTFRHDKELKFGAPEIRPDILKAIRNSRMLIVVLSQNYASSTCCLDELAEIVDSYDKKGSQVLIIFYKVEPSDVWDLKNTYADAMAEHEISFEKDLEKVKTWRTALSRVRQLSREYCSDTKYESELIKKIVKDTSSKLPPTPLPINHIVGLDSRFEQVEEGEGHDDILELDIDMPIILEACHFGEAPTRRYWGKLEIQQEDPTYKAVLRKTSQLARRFWRIQGKEMMNVVLLESLSQSESPSTEEASTSGHGEEEEEYYNDPVLDELMTRIEDDTMSLNKTYGKLKASIVLCTSEELVSDIYLQETVMLRGQHNKVQGNTELANIELLLAKSGISGLGLRVMRSNFKRTPYGRLRVEDDGPYQTAQNKNVNQNQKQHDFSWDAGSPSITQNPNKFGWTHVLMRWILCCSTSRSYDT